MRVGLVAVEGCFSSGIVAMLDILRIAETLRHEVDPSITPIRVELVGARRKVIAGSGVILPTTRSLTETDDLDVIALGSFDALTLDEALSALASRDGQAVLTMLRRQSGAGPVLAAACTGTFALADAGVLDGHRATTSWWLGPPFRTRYPEVHLDLDAMLVEDNGTLTAGAAFAHIDLALRLVRDVSPRLAETAAKMLVIDPRPTQTTYMALDHIEHTDSLVLAFERYARAHLADADDITAMAGAIGTSRRTLERRLTRSLGTSPVALVQRLRVERATHLLRTTGQSTDQIAPQVGYANGSTLRALIRRLG